MRETAVRATAGHKPELADAPPEGGKVLERLRYFQLTRGFAPVEAPGEEVMAGAHAGMAVAPPAAGGRQEVGNLYLEAFDRARVLSDEAPAVPVPIGWRPLGPFLVPHGQTYGSGPGSRPSISGRVSAIAVDPSNASHILVGAAGGGVWESTDAGATWAPRTDAQPALATGAIAYDPSNPAIVYAGTGEGNFYFQLGAGLLRSMDGGTTWAMRATAPFVGSGFFDLAVDPLNGNNILAASTAGLYSSADGGATWTQRRSAYTWDVSIHPAVVGDPNSTKEVFAGCRDGVYRSIDGGNTWAAAALPGAPVSYERIAVCHSASDGAIVFVFAAAAGIGYLWRRATFGGAFSAETIPTGVAVNQAWYDWFASTAPNNPDVLYCGAINTHKGVRSAAGVWAWTNISANTIGDSIHPDQHCIAFNPSDPNGVYIGCDGGIFGSPDAGTTWRSLNKGLCITEFEYLAQHTQWDAWLLAGTQDNGTMRYEGDEVWYHVADGDGGDCALNSASPYTCFHTYYSMGMERSTTGGGWGSWTWIGPTPPAGHQSLFYPPVEANGDVVAQAGSIVFISGDSGTTWNQVPLPAGEVASALAIPTSTRVYAATMGGNVYQIDFSAGAWQAPVALAQPRAGYVSDVEVDPTNANRLYATYSSAFGAGHVYRSDDGGATWTDVSAGLPVIPVNAITIDPANPTNIYIACDVGVYRSTTAGGNWTNFSNLLPNALCADLKLHAPSRLLRVATKNRGIWETAVDVGSMPDVQLYLRDDVIDTGRATPSPSGPDPFSQGNSAFWWQCADVKVDSPPYQQANPTDVDFGLFGDDHGVFAAGLIHEPTQRGTTVRVYVQVHNRGVNPATAVAVKAFYADASLGAPDLPAGFWAGFPNNVLPATSPWQPVGPHTTVPSVESGRPSVVEFDWAVPATAADHTCLLAVVTAANDAINTADLGIAAVVTNQTKCGLKNLVVVNPPPRIPRPWLTLLYMHASKERARYHLGADRPLRGAVRAVVLSKTAAKLAATHSLARIELTEIDKAKLSQLIKQRPKLEGTLELAMAFVPPARSNVWFKGLPIDPRQPEPLVVLFSPKPRQGKYSLIQWREDGQVAGGFTFEVLGTRQ